MIALEGVAMRTLEGVAVKVDILNDYIEIVTEAMETAGADGEMTPSMKRLHSLVYLLGDQIKAIGQCLDEASGHFKVCNAIHVVELQREQYTN